MLVQVARLREMLEGFDADEWVDFTVVGGKKVPFITSAKVIMEFLRANPTALLRVEDGEGRGEPYRVYIELDGKDMLRMSQKTYFRLPDHLNGGPEWQQVKTSGTPVPGTVDYVKGKVAWSRPIFKT